MDSANLIKQVRTECGKVTNTDELEDIDIINESKNIISIIAERLPQKALRYITSVLNTRRYDTDAGTMRIQVVFSEDGVDPNIMDLGNDIVDDSGFGLDEDYNFPSLWTIKMMRKNRGLPRIDYHFDPINKKLDIDPMPREAGKKYYYMSIEKGDWTLAKVPTDFEAMLTTGTSWKCLEIVALKRSKLGGIQRSGGFVDYPYAGLRTYIDAKKEEFWQALNIKEKLHSP